MAAGAGSGAGQDAPEGRIKRRGQVEGSGLPLCAAPGLLPQRGSPSLVLGSGVRAVPPALP